MPSAVPPVHEYHYVLLTNRGKQNSNGTENCCTIYIICRVHLKHTVYFLKCSCKYSLLFFFSAPHLVSSKSYKIIYLKEIVLITDVILKNLSHLGLCGALSCCINSMVIFDVASGLGGMACTVPICGKCSPISVATSIPFCSSFTTSVLDYCSTRTPNVYLQRGNSIICNSSLT